MLSHKLKELRKIHNLTQGEFAAIFGVSTSAVSMWENEQREPDIGMLEKIANYFDVSTDYLLGRSAAREPGELVIPEVLEDVKVAFHRGDEGLTQDEIDKIAEFAEFLKSQRKKR